MEHFKGDLIKELAKEVISELEDKKKREKRKKTLHNTKLLMENYNTLQAHVYKTDDKVLKFKEVEDKDDEIFLESIIRTKMRTAKMISYVDSALKIVKSDFIKNMKNINF